MPVKLGLQDFTRRRERLRRRDRQGRRRGQQGRPGHFSTGDAVPVVNARAVYTIPLRTPFALTGSATDGDGDTLSTPGSRTTAAARRARRSSEHHKTNGPLFAMFPISGQISESDTLLYDSPGENHLTTEPDAGLPGPPADPGQQHECRHRRLPDRADRAAGADSGQGVLRGIPPDARTTSASRLVNAAPALAAHASDRA